MPRPLLRAHDQPPRRGFQPQHGDVGVEAARHAFAVRLRERHHHLAGRCRAASQFRRLRLRSHDGQRPAVELAGRGPTPAPTPRPRPTRAKLGPARPPTSRAGAGRRSVRPHGVRRHRRIGRRHPEPGVGDPHVRQLLARGDGEGDLAGGAGIGCHAVQVGGAIAATACVTTASTRAARLPPVRCSRTARGRRLVLAAGASRNAPPPSATPSRSRRTSSPGPLIRPSSVSLCISMPHSLSPQRPQEARRAAARRVKKRSRISQSWGRSIDPLS